MSESTHHVHVKGIGGPGAPHVLALDRYEDLQSEGRLNFPRACKATTVYFGLGFRVYQQQPEVS